MADESLDSDNRGFIGVVFSVHEAVCDVSSDELIVNRLYTCCVLLKGGGALNDGASLFTTPEGMST